MKPKIGSLGIILFLCIFILGTQGLMAQEQDEEVTLEEVIVTAQKRESDLQKTPISIQTVSGTELTAEGKKRLDEIMQGIVGVSSQGSQVGTDFYMRGLGTADFGPPMGGIRQSAVAVLIDGIYQNRGEVVRGGTLDMNRVEVMRGTQSTTLGGSSLAGAVSLVSNQPSFEYEGYGSLTLGSHELVETNAVLNAPISENQAFRIAYSSEKRDGYLASNAGNSDQTNARIKYRWQPTDNFNMVATWNHQVIGGNGVDTAVLTYNGVWEGYDPTKVAVPDPLGPPGATICANPDGCYGTTMGDPAMFGWLGGPGYPNYDQRDDPWNDGYPADAWPNNPFRDTEINQYNLNIDWDLGFGTLTVIPSFQKAHFRSVEPPRGNSFRAEDRKQETKQFDVQLASSADSSFEWLAGIYWYDTSFSGTMMSVGLNGMGGGPPPPPGAPPGPCDPAPGAEHTYCYESTNPNEQTTFAYYANMSYPILDNLRFNAGIRYNEDEKSFNRSGQTAGNAAGPTAPFVYNSSDTAEWDEITYRIGAEYDLSEDAMAYLLFATGYQPGSWSFNTPTGKQTLDQWTIGLKSLWLDNRLRFNVEAFSSEYHNRPMQGTVNYFTDGWDYVANGTSCGFGMGPGAQPYAYYGVGDACYSVSSPLLPELTSEGVDLEISWLIARNDRLDASVEYLESVQGAPELGVTQSMIEGFYSGDTATATAVYNGLSGLAGQYDGLTLQNSPEWSYNASYSHIFNLWDGSTLTPKINLEYRDTYWSQGGGPGANIVQPGPSIQDSYTLWNFYVNWTSSDGKFTISGFVKNIDDKPIKTNVGVEPDPTAPMYVTLAPPRTYGIVLSMRF